MVKFKNNMHSLLELGLRTYELNQYFHEGYWWIYII